MNRKLGRLLEPGMEGYFIVMPPFITAWRIVLMTWAKNQAESAVIR